MPRYGLIDVGSNTIRLCIFEVANPDKRIFSKKKDFISLINHKNMAGLAAYVEDGIITDKGITQAASVLKGHLKRLNYFNCTQTAIFATAALRNARNALEAKHALERKIEHHINVLSAADEAHLGVVGAQSSHDFNQGLVIDLGGGSCEFSLVEDGLDRLNISVPVGTLSSYATCVRGVFPTKQEAECIQGAFRRAQTKALVACGVDTANLTSQLPLIGLGGSLRAIQKLHVVSTGQEERPGVLSKQEIQHAIEVALINPEHFAHLAFKAVPDRVHTIIPGCLILEEIMRTNQVEEIHMAKGGIREGFLIERMLHGRAR